MVLNVPEIPPKVTGIVTLSGGRRGGPGKTTLSLLGWGGRGGKAIVTMSFYMTFFVFDPVPNKIVWDGVFPI